MLGCIQKSNFPIQPGFNQTAPKLPAWLKFVGSEFGILEGLGGFTIRFWYTNLVLEGFSCSVFPDLGLSLAHFLPNRIEVRDFWRGLNGFEVQFWCMNLGSSEFKVWPVKFKAVRCSL